MLIEFSVLNQLVALGAVGMEIGAVLLLVLWFLRNRGEVYEEYSVFVSWWGLWLGAALTLATIIISLYYSEVLGFEPCGLCWTIRIFSYSQFFLFVVALMKGGDRSVADYSIVLSALGLPVALYQHYLQMGGTELINCPAVSTGADCADRFLFAFGHVTFPWVAVTLFALLITVMLFVRRKE